MTNDIYTTEDADHLRRVGVLEERRIAAVETGCCPHTAIRDDISANLDAVERLEAELGDVELTLIESGGDNLTAIFSRASSICRSSCSIPRAVTTCHARADRACAMPTSS